MQEETYPLSHSYIGIWWK